MTREEAIKVVRNIYQTDAEKEALETLIPELKDSEDEKIRKFLIQHISEWIGCIEHDLKNSSKDIESEKELAMFKAGLAYLEKQAKSERVIKAARRVLNNWLDDSGCLDMSGDFTELEYAIREYDGDEKQKEPENVSASTMAPSCWEVKQKEQNDEDEFLEDELSAFLQNYDKEYDDDAAVSDVARHFYEIGKKQKEQKPVPFSCSHEKGQPADPVFSKQEYESYPIISTVNSEYDKGYMDGKAFQLKQTEQYSIGKTFMGLIPCWVNAPSTLQPAHKYHGKNAVIMHENNGGFRCCFIDDEKATTIHLPENTGFVEGWRKKPAEQRKATINDEPIPTENHYVDIPSAEWSDEDEEMRDTCIDLLKHFPRPCGEVIGPWKDCIAWLKALRPSWKPNKEQMEALNRELELLSEQLKKL